MTSGLTYDAGALVAAERGDRKMLALHRETLRRGVLPVVPAVVLAQTWRGGPQPLLSRMLVGCSIETLTEPHARMSGALCGRAGTADIVDAMVVMGALERGDVVVTSDPNDVRHLANSAQQPIELITI